MNALLKSVSFFVDQFYRYPFNQELALQTLRDSLSTGQMRSKNQIINICTNLNLKSDRALFIGHWHSLLPLMMYNSGFLSEAIGVEKSDLWSDFSNYLNRDWRWKSDHQDIQQFKYPEHVDLVVNTSCEHMSNEWLSSVPRGCRVILQSTNYEHPEHINRKVDLEDFKKSLEMIDIQYEDVLDCDVYSRFTIVGLKK